MPNALIQSYLKDIASNIARGIATEHSYRPFLQILIESLYPKVKAVNEPKRISVGAPDFILLDGQTPLGYIETKDVGHDLDKKETKEQLTRYVNGLGNVILTDYLTFRWYQQNVKTPVYTVTLATKQGKKIIVNEQAGDELISLFQQCISSDAATVKTAKELAKRMANIARIINNIIQAAVALPESTSLHETMHSFREVLLHDMTEDQFADMYSQTICYGMFAARVNHNISKAPFERKTAGYDLPKTNPFLRQLFNTIAGPELDDSVTWAVDDLANLLSHADMEGILKDFGKSTRKEDPVVHFYETFLAEYNPKLRESRGVYYTPEPVVSYIVRSVDQILQTEFGLENGLADTSKIQVKTHAGETEEIHKVLILDPAVGTGTFLHGVVDNVNQRFSGNEGAWSTYVSEHLLPRLFGFELLMAPYAVAHLKLGLQLKDSGYDFQSDERLRVYLTNTLEEAFQSDEKLPLTNWLANEANAANEVKRDLPIMVILGNPPYSNFGMMNKGKWIQDLLKPYKEGLNERKINIDDDFIKFIRFAQWRIEQTGYGIAAYISNNTYIDGITHRKMRESLLNSFDEIFILNLHGSVKKRDVGEHGEKDENVFDIQQGVCISLFIKKNEQSKGRGNIKYMALKGNRESKYTSLSNNSVETTGWTTISPIAPQYFFTPKDFSLEEEYAPCFSVNKMIFSECNAGIQTKNDSLVYQFTLDEIKRVISDLLKMKTKEFDDEYQINKEGVWTTEKAKKDVSTNEGKYVQIHYRPFDIRWTYYTGKADAFMARPRAPLMRNALQKNLVLLTVRNPRRGNTDSFFVASRIVDKDGVSPFDNATFFPLYLYSDRPSSDLFSESNSSISGADSKSNFTPEFIAQVEKRLKLTYIQGGKRDFKKSFGPEDIFYYMYAVFYSPMYRKRYAEFLKIDFPRLPLTSDKSLFSKLSKLGERLASLHLMEAFGKSLIKYPQKGTDEVEFVKYLETSTEIKKPRVQINDDQYFEGIPREVWEFQIGGYQVAQKWLKDRKGRKLSYDDLSQYGHIISALSETMSIMSEIDKVIEASGGFPFK